MKISAITPHFFEMPLENPISDARNTITHRSCVLIEASTDEGLTGWGEAASFAGCGELIVHVVKFFEKKLLGRDPLKPSDLYDEMYHGSQHFGRRGLVINALSGIDIALWDIFAKKEGLPLYQVLGANRDDIQFYFNGGYFVEGDNLKFLQQSVEGAIERGAGAVKIKLGRFGLEDDIKRIEIARKILGDDCDLMVDANATMTIKDVVLLDDAMQKNKVRWMEEPIPIQKIENLCELRAKVKTPIAGYELEQTLEGYSELINHKAIDVVQPDTIWSGGVTECQRIASVAALQSIEFVPHNFATIVALAANAHVAAAAPTGGWLEVDSNVNPFLWDLDKNQSYQLKEGKIFLPNKPGIGVDPDLGIIEQYRQTL